MSLTTNLVAYWKLDESSGNAADATGNGFNLTNTNTVSYAAGLINNGADFGSGNSSNHRYLTISNNLGINGGNITISAWLYNVGTTGRFSLGCGSGTSFVLYNMIYSNGIRFGRYRVPAGNTFTANTVLPDNVWNHCVLTYDGINIGGYVNNVAVTGVAASGSGSSILTSQTTIGGIPQVGASEFFSGKMDEIGIWSRVLSAGEVSTLYNGGVGLSYPFTPPAPSTMPGFFLNFC